MTRTVEDVDFDIETTADTERECHSPDCTKVAVTRVVVTPWCGHYGELCLRHYKEHQSRWTECLRRYREGITLFRPLLYCTKCGHTEELPEIRYEKIH